MVGLLNQHGSQHGGERQVGFEGAEEQEKERGLGDFFQGAQVEGQGRGQGKLGWG